MAAHRPGCEWHRSRTLVDRCVAKYQSHTRMMINVGYYMQETHGRQQGCCACSGHLRVHPFLETLRARLRILATGSQRSIVRCIHTSYVSVDHHILSPNAACAPVPSKPTVFSRTTQTIIALTVSTTHRAARCLLRPSTASRFSREARSLSLKQSVRVRRSLLQMARLPPHRVSLWSRPRRRSRPRALLAGRHQIQHLRPHRMHLRTRHTLRSTAGSRLLSILLTMASKVLKALRPKPSR